MYGLWRGDGEGEEFGRERRYQTWLSRNSNPSHSFLSFSGGTKIYPVLTPRSLMVETGTGRGAHLERGGR